MFIAHIPVGLCIARAVTRQPLTWRTALTAGLGAIFPDLDLLRFYLIDNGQVHHHSYWTHLPAYWGAFIILLMLGAKLFKKRIPKECAVFVLAVVSHLLLDSVAGDIRWLWPFSDNGFKLVTVPVSHGKWYLSFLHHWTFKFEILISLLALLMSVTGHGYKDPKSTRTHSG